MSPVPHIEFIGSLFVFAGHSISLGLMSPRRFGLRRTWAIWGGAFLLSAATTLLCYLAGIPYAFMTCQVISLVICAVAFLSSSQGNFLRNLFLYASYLNFFLFSVALSEALAHNLVDGDPLAIMEFRLIIICIFCVVLVYDLRPAFLRIAADIPQGWGALTVLVCIFCGCLLAVAFFSNLFSSFTHQMLVMLLVLFVIMLSAYIVIFKTIAALSKENQKSKLELEKKFLTHQLTSYEQLEREERKYHHDFRHHNLLILEYAKNRDCDAIIRYLQEYETSVDKKLNQRICANMTVNSIVTAFLKRAQEQNIAMRVDIRMGEETAVRDTDLVAILANLLENAVKGALLADGEPWVELMIGRKGNKLRIQCRNSCAGDIRFAGGLPQAVGRVGIGVTSIMDTAALYAGNTEFFAENGVFTGRVLLNEAPLPC